MLGWQDAAILMGVGFLLFGAQRLPDTLKALGLSAVEFKKGLDGKDDSKP
ncbi:MAG TPA: twin-arginine translocase TatA/TatE family subunit [Candidatus Xenobia bacterium]|jgi:TatA/E family protein of Tat protein translocase